jgi:hypothetical protein
MKKLLKNILLGIGLGSAVFLIICIVFDILGGGSFSLSHWLFTKMAIGSMIVGVGFSVPSMVYDKDRLSRGVQSVIHMGIGSAIMLAVAFIVGWIPVSSGWLACALTILGELFLAFLIWLVFALYYRRLAKEMNKRLQDM